MTVFSLHISKIQKKKLYLLTAHHNVIYSNISNASIANKESVHSVRTTECKCKGNNNDNGRTYLFVTGQCEVTPLGL